MEEQEPSTQPPKERSSRLRRFLSIAGPGVITGGGDNDPAGVATYSKVGATFGYTQLWLLVISIPLLICVQGTAARLGSVTKLGLAELIRNEFGAKVAIMAATIVVIANVGTIGADLVAMAAVLQLLTGIRLIFFIVPLVVVMGYVTIFLDFKAIQRILLWLILVFATYVVAGFLARPDWSHVLINILEPHVRFSAGYLTAAVGLLGTTITPYLFYWQAAGEREERRGVERMGDTYVDISSGMVVSNVIASFIVISTGATLFQHHQHIQTASDAARALEPVAGPAASLLFSVGILGAGLLAIPILSVSTGYVIAGTLGWRMGLGRQAFTAPGFYSVIALALLAGVELAISGVSPIRALFYSQVFYGIITPPLLCLMLILASRRGLMGAYTSRLWERTGGWIAVGVMTAADIGFFYTVFR